MWARWDFSGKQSKCDLKDFERILSGEISNFKMDSFDKSNVNDNAPFLKSKLVEYFSFHVFNSGNSTLAKSG